MEAAAVPAGRTGRKGRSSYGGDERRLARFMLAPSMAVIALVALYPIVYAIWLSLHEYSLRQAGVSRWTEPHVFANYTDALTSSEFWDAFVTTFIFTAGSVTGELILGLIMALIMHQAFKGQGLLRTVVLVPWAVLTVVTAIMWQTIFEPELGFVNSLLGAVGLPDDTVWLGREPHALLVMIFADIWKTSPFMALLLLAGLQVIPNEIYEAAKVDGANVWQRFTNITLPLLMPAIVVALIFRTLDALRIFDLPFVLTKGAYGTNTLSLIAYEELRENRLIGEGSALSIMTFVIVMAVSFVYIRFSGGNLRAMTQES